MNRLLSRCVSKPRQPVVPRRPLSSTTTRPPPQRAAAMANQATARSEAAIKRNPHGDFKTVEAARPPWNASAEVPRFTQTVDPGWQFGSGANAAHTDRGLSKGFVAIDPYEDGRPPAFNYKLLISAVVPRPIAFVSTRGPDPAAEGGVEGGGAATTTNLAPFSYFQMIGHDPPLFMVSFASDIAAQSGAKDTLRNLLETGECVVSIISEGFLEAANACSVNAGYGLSEWAVSGLTPAHDCQTVRCARVREAVFSIEARLVSATSYRSRANSDRVTATMVVVEGTRFWAREDAINEEKNLLDPAVLRPISRMGGITYGRTVEAVELLRPDFDKTLGGETAYEKLEKDAAAKWNAAKENS